MAGTIPDPGAAGFGSHRNWDGRRQRNLYPALPLLDGEDGTFDLNTITEAELRQFPNLKHITLMSSKPEQVLPVLERCGIKAGHAVRCAAMNENLFRPQLMH